MADSRIFQSMAGVAIPTREETINEASLCTVSFTHILLQHRVTVTSLAISILYHHNPSHGISCVFRGNYTGYSALIKQIFFIFCHLASFKSYQRQNSGVGLI